MNGHTERIACLLALYLAAALGLGASSGSGDSNGAFPPEEVVLAVETGLFLDEAVQASDIDVANHDGIVTLTGKVDNLLAKERATKRAQRVKGVRAVVNRIRIDAPPVPDAILENAVAAAMRDDPAADEYEVRVEASNGSVRLTGAVDSRAEKELAATIAGSVRGVTAVRNEIFVQPPIRRNDEEIRADITQRLRWDVYIDGGLITIAVDDAHVTLAGTVGSAAQKQRAIGDAYVEGVLSVDADDVEVSFWARNERLRKDRYAYMTAEAIEVAVGDALRHDPRVDASDVVVNVRRREASLTGTVDSLRARRAAGETAANVVGVWSVVNALEVHPPSVPSDETLRSKIQHRFFFDSEVSGERITVTVDAGEVDLLGSATSQSRKERAEELATSVEGVTKVSNYILVVPREVFAQKSDWEIQESIESQLYWSPFVDSDEVEVTVSDGTATLTGVVDTPMERRAAEDNAREGGAAAVHNKLEIR